MRNKYYSITLSGNEKEKFHRYPQDIRVIHQLAQ